MNLKRMLATTGLAALVSLGTHTAIAQPGGGEGGGRRGFDPARMQEFQQRMMENIRENMSVTNDAEWKAIETRVQKVMDARRDVGGFGRGMMGRRGGDGGGPGGGPGGRPQIPELEALQKAIDSNAPADQIKAALQKYRDARKVKQAALDKAQADLQQVLTVKQEAVAVTFGLLN